MLIFCGMRGKINLDELYTASGDFKYYDNGFNLTAFQSPVAVILSLGGKFIPHLWSLCPACHGFVGVISCVRCLCAIEERTGFENTGEKKLAG